MYRDHDISYLNSRRYDLDEAVELSANDSETWRREDSSHVNDESKDEVIIIFPSLGTENPDAATSQK